MTLEIDGIVLDDDRIVCSYMDYGHGNEADLYQFEFTLNSSSFDEIFGERVDGFISESQEDYCDDDDDEPSLKQLKGTGFLRSSILFKNHPSVLVDLIEEFLKVDLLSEVMSDNNGKAQYVVYRCNSLSIDGDNMVVNGTARKM